MTPADAVEEVYGELRRNLPALLLARLKFKEPDFLRKQGSSIWRGRILGARPKCIFDATWCFYEIGIGRYAVESPLESNSGGVGLICFVENAKCGSGAHAGVVDDLGTNFASKHEHFVPSRRGDKLKGVFRYYSNAIPGRFPTQAAASDLSALITETLDELEALTVAK